MPKKSAKSSKPHKVPVHGAAPPHRVRIIGGAWKRSLLPVVDALGLRPTPDRVRETVFNWINHLWNANWSNAQVLDLYAGSGALGFEAASRGAAQVTMIDSHTPVVRQLEDVKLKLKAENVQVQRADALASAQSMALRGQRFDLVFLDPPYDQNLLSKSLPLCIGLLNPDGLVYAEAAAPLPFADAASDGAADDDGAEAEPVPDWLAPWELVRQDKAGIVFYHLLKLRASAG